MGVARVQTPMGGLIGMNGSGPGFVARMYRLPVGATVVLLTNTNLEDGTVNAIFEQAVQVTLESVAVTAFQSPRAASGGDAMNPSRFDQVSQIHLPPSSHGAP